MIEPTHTGVAQIVSQETGISLVALKLNTDISRSTSGRNTLPSIYECCQRRFGRTVQAPGESVTFGDLLNLLGIK